MQGYHEGRVKFSMVSLTDLLCLETECNTEQKRSSCIFFGVSSINIPCALGPNNREQVIM